MSIFRSTFNRVCAAAAAAAAAVFNLRQSIHLMQERGAQVAWILSVEKTLKNEKLPQQNVAILLEQSWAQPKMLVAVSRLK